MSFVKFLLLCNKMTADSITIKFWWTSQEFFYVDIIPPWFSMLIYHLGDEQ
jgi:hypothetical protein